jgi:hypothetical protein
MIVPGTDLDDVESAYMRRSHPYRSTQIPRTKSERLRIADTGRVSGIGHVGIDGEIYPTGAAIS